MAGPSNLTRRTVDDLGKAIVTQHFAGRDFPYEADLCARYDASRPIVREAVKLLTAKGLLFARPRKGTQVQPERNWNLSDPDVLRWLSKRDFSIELLIDFTDMRLAIEPRAAALAARAATEPQRQAIEAAIEGMFAAERGEGDPLASDIAFHVAVLEASNNRFLRQFSDLAETTLRFSIRRTNAYRGVARASATDHARVMTAILRGEADLAFCEMFGLIHGAMDLLVAADVESRNPSSDQEHP